MSRNRVGSQEEVAHVSLSVEAESWDRWVTQHADGHPLQLSGWGTLKAQFGWDHRQIALLDAHGMICAGAQVLLRSAYGIKLAYIPRGPLMEWTDEALREALLASLRAECLRAGAAVLKIEPDLLDTPANRALLLRSGFTPGEQTVQPPSTIRVGLADDDAMLATMKSKWRYNIRLAERKGVTVRAMQRSDLPAFHRLMRETGVRDGFAVHSDAYFTAAFDMLTPDHAVFLLAEHTGEALAAIVVALSGKSAVYLWGASSERERSRMPNHALQWAGMRWAREHGATRYDLWGIPDDLGRLAMALAHETGEGVSADALPIQLDASPGDGLWGVYRFKQGFGGHIVRTVGAWDMPIHPLGARLYFAGLTARHWTTRAIEALPAYTTRTAPDPVGAVSKPHLSPTMSSNQVGSVFISQAPDHSGSTASKPRLRYCVEQIELPDRWRAVLAQTPAPHVLQSWEWGEVKAQTGWRAERLAVETAADVAAFQFLWREPIPHAPVRVAYIPKGPSLDWSNLDLVDEALAAIEATARRKGCTFVKIDPDVREDTTVGRLALHALQRRGWRYSTEQIQFKNTAITDLKVSEETLFTTIKSKWRYNVRLAEKRGIIVRFGQEAELTDFYDLYAETGKRDGFLIRPADYYLTTWRTFLRAQRDPENPAGGALLLAEHPDEPKPVAALFLLRYGATAWYFYGASSERRRRDMPNHLLQWEAMRWADAQGCTTYDWWGAPTVLEDPNDRMQGVWYFKHGFGAEFQPHIGAWDFVISRAGYQLVTEGLPYVLATMQQIRRLCSQ